MKKKAKKEETILIDLSDRKNLKIIHSSKKQVSEKDMEEFERRFSNIYDNYREFTELCIQKNKEKNRNQISQQTFNESMKSMLEQNIFLESVISLKAKKNN